MSIDPRILEQVQQREWFYRFDLPDGSSTTSYLPEQVRPVHETRLAMMRERLEPLCRAEDLTAIDFGSHQGWFSVELAKMGCNRITGVEPRQRHIEDARLMVQALGLESKISFIQSSVEQIDSVSLEPADIVLMVGLLYHLENPVAAIRTAYKYCRRVTVIETQVGPHLSGMLDWGNAEFVRPIKGCFCVIDETEETHGPEASTAGICLVPSAETLVWIMQRVGFRDVALINPPDDGYEQHRHRKRVLAVGYR